MAVFNSRWRLSFCQPSLTKRSSTLASYEEEVKIRAARFCSFCSLMERDLQHDSLPFLPLASCFMTFWLGYGYKSKSCFWMRRWPTCLGFSIFEFFFLAFLCLSQAPLGWSLWSGHHWKDLFLLQKLSINDSNFGQKVWRQKSKKGQGLSRQVTGATGVNGLILYTVQSY